MSNQKKSFLMWTVGGVEIFQIVEIEGGKLIQSIIPQATPQNIREISWLTPFFADKQGNLKAQVQSFLIKSGEKNILIDTCNGNDKNRPNTPDWSNLQTNFLHTLRNTGISEADIDIVACTHLHFDHVGWNTRLEGNRWVPTFPNASYLFAKEEYAYWKGRPEKEIEDDHLGFNDSVIPVVNARLAKLVESDYVIDGNIRFISTPGHTSHHISISVTSLGRKAIISGDIVHHPCQIAHPEWTTTVDTYPDQAIESRQQILRQIADTNTILIGSHFADPVAGKVINFSGGYILKV